MASVLVEKKEQLVPKIYLPDPELLELLRSCVPEQGIAFAHKENPLDLEADQQALFVRPVGREEAVANTASTTYDKVMFHCTGQGVLEFKDCCAKPADLIKWVCIQIYRSGMPPRVRTV